MQHDDMIVMYLVHEAFIAISNITSACIGAGLETTDSYQEFIDGYDFADRFAGLYQAVEVFIARAHAAAFSGSDLCNFWRRSKLAHQRDSLFQEILAQRKIKLFVGRTDNAAGSRCSAASPTLSSTNG